MMSFNTKTFPYKRASILFGIMVGVISLNPFSIVPTGHRGVLATFGNVDQTKNNPEGLYFVFPIFQKMHLINVQIQKTEATGNSASKDMQTVSTSVAINYHIDPVHASEVFKKIGTEEALSSKIIVPALQESVKAATSQYTAEELITKRAVVRDSIRDLVSQKLTRHGVIVDEFSITNFHFSEEYNNAIESKTTAEQLRLKALVDLKRINIESEQKVSRAIAEAESLRLQKAQITPEMIQLRQTENQAKAIDKWNGVLPNFTGNAAVPFIKLDK